MLYSMAYFESEGNNSGKGTFPYDREEGWYNPSSCDCSEYERQRQEEMFPWKKDEPLRQAPGLIRGPYGGQFGMPTYEG